MTTTAPAVEARELEKSFSGDPPTRALRGVSLSVRDNEFFTLLGPSGCGKTTILRIIAGLERPDSGAVLLFGADITALPPNRRPVNTVFQHYALFPHMTVAENVGFGLKMLGAGDSDIRAAVKETLGLTHMSDFAARMPAQLSGGQKQRVALARSLAPRPKVLLLDEPLSALDLKLRQAMRMELKRIQRETGVTFIFVTHDQEEALAMSDRVAVMRDGLAEQVGAAREIYERPRSRFVADFIGDINMTEAQVETVENGAAVFRVAEGLRARTAIPEGRELKVGAKATLALRPERVRLSGEGAPAVVADAVYAGDDTLYILSLPGGETLRARASNADGRPPLSPGDSARLQIDEDAWRVLED